MDYRREIYEYHLPGVLTRLAKEHVKELEDCLELKDEALGKFIFDYEQGEEYAEKLWKQFGFTYIHFTSWNYLNSPTGEFDECMEECYDDYNEYQG